MNKKRIYRGEDFWDALANQLDKEMVELDRIRVVDAVPLAKSKLYYKVTEGLARRHEEYLKEQTEMLRLRYCDLTGINFEPKYFDNCAPHPVMLSGANIEMSNLTNANLNHVVLAGSMAERTIFTNAQLRSTNLKGSNLRYAKLDGTQCMRTTFDNCDLEYADVTGMLPSLATFQGANLMYVRGLESIAVTLLQSVNFDAAIVSTERERLLTRIGV